MKYLLYLINMKHCDIINKLQNKYNLFLQTLDIELFSSKNSNYNYNDIVKMAVDHIEYHEMMDKFYRNEDYNHRKIIEEIKRYDNYNCADLFLINSTCNYDDYKLYKTKKIFFKINKNR